MSTPSTSWGPSPNAEATEAWDGPLYDRFVQYRHLVVDALGPHGEAALKLVPPAAGERVLDIGCGFGDTTQRIAGLVGAGGEVVGVDVAPRFIETATREAAEAGVENVSFHVRDVQFDSLGEDYDLAFSRMGTMFFASPVAALRNVLGALKPGGRLVMVVWRRREDNDWMYRAQQVVEALVPRNEESDEPTCGPGPFSMANADTVSEILKFAGFEDIALHRCDLDVLFGTDVDEAIAVNLAIGPAGELMRLAGDSAAPLLPRIDAELRAALAEYVRDDGIYAPASTWIVTARAPG